LFEHRPRATPHLSSCPGRDTEEAGPFSPGHTRRTLASSKTTPQRRQRNLGRPHSGR
jgi:hypothetical protein